MNDVSRGNPFLISSEDKFKYILLLEKNNIFSLLQDLYIFKSNGLSISSYNLSLYKICIDNLLKMSFFPFIETNIDKNLLSARPFKSYCEVPLELNQLLRRNVNNDYSLFIAFSNISSLRTKIWLRKNSPLDFDLLNNISTRFNYDDKLKYMESFYSVVFNLILNGMLWIIFSNKN